MKCRIEAEVVPAQPQPLQATVNDALRISEQLMNIAVSCDRHAVNNILEHFACTILCLLFSQVLCLSILC